MIKRTPRPRFKFNNIMSRFTDVILKLTENWFCRTKTFHVVVIVVRRRRSAWVRCPLIIYLSRSLWLSLKIVCYVVAVGRKSYLRSPHILYCGRLPRARTCRHNYFGIVLLVQRTTAAETREKKNERRKRPHIKKNATTYKYKKVSHICPRACIMHAAAANYKHTHAKNTHTYTHKSN